LLRDTSGSPLNGYIYDAWGALRSQTGTIANPFTYTSREIGEAGLMYYRARYYNPSVGRFTSVDPLIFVNTTAYDSSDDFQSSSKILTLPEYTYSNNSPVDKTDPFGLDAGHPERLRPRCFEICADILMTGSDRCIKRQRELERECQIGLANSFRDPTDWNCDKDYKLCKEAVRGGTDFCLDLAGRRYARCLEKKMCCRPSPPQ